MRIWIEKQKYLVDFTLSCLARRKAKNLGLLLVYTAIVFVLASVMLFTQALRREAAKLLERSPELIVQRMIAGRHDLVPSDYLDRIGRIRGVQKREARLWGYYYDPATRANYTFMAEPAEAGLSVSPGKIALGSGIARALRAQLHEPVAFLSYSGQVSSYIVQEILPERAELLAADLVLMAEADFRAFFNYPPGQYTDIALSIANPQEVRSVAARISRELPDSRPILREEILRTYESIFNWREGMMLAILFGAILAFAIFALERAAALSADEKREIGILKAIGWETADIIKMKVWEGALISVAAFLAGYLTAYLHVFRFSGTLFEPVLKGWAVLYPHFSLTPEIDTLQVATLFFFTVFPYAAATVVPIWRAAITDPDSVMRG